MTLIADKLEVNGAFISPPPPTSLHQCTVLRVFKASQSYTERREVKTRMWCHRASNSKLRALRRSRTNQLCNPCPNWFLDCFFTPLDRSKHLDFWKKEEKQFSCPQYSPPDPHSLFLPQCKQVPRPLHSLKGMRDVFLWPHPVHQSEWPCPKRCRHWDLSWRKQPSDTAN